MKKVKYIRVSQGRGFFLEGKPRLYNLTEERQMGLDELANYEVGEVQFVFKESISDGLRRHYLNLFYDVQVKEPEQLDLLNFLH
jgi:hypothetical protein